MRGHRDSASCTRFLCIGAVKTSAQALSIMHRVEELASEKKVKQPCACGSCLCVMYIKASAHRFHNLEADGGVGIETQSRERAPCQEVQSKRRGSRMHD